MTKTKLGWVETVEMPTKHLPYKWRDRLFAEGRIGGVMYVFIEGGSRGEIDEKVKKIKEFCKTLKEEL